MLGALVTTSRELQEKVIPLLDNLTCQLLALCESLSLYNVHLFAQFLFTVFPFYNSS